MHTIKLLEVGAETTKKSAMSDTCPKFTESNFSLNGPIPPSVATT